MEMDKQRPPPLGKTDLHSTANCQLSTVNCQLKNVAPTEKQPDGSVLCGQVHDPLARVMNGGISGNAGVFSCAEDIAVLCAALQNGGEWNGRRILSPLGVKAMRTVPRATATLGRTLGWDSFTAYASNNGDYFGPNTYGHTGYTGTSIIIDPDNDTSVILLVNAVHPEDGHSMVRLRSLVANVVAASIYPTPRIYTDHYYKRFLQFMDEPAITSKDIVMVGNSLTEGGGDWNARLNKKTSVTVVSSVMKLWVFTTDCTRYFRDTLRNYSSLPVSTTSHTTSLWTASSV